MDLQKIDMLIPKKQLEQIQEIVAGDKCFLREIFHPDRDDVPTKHSLAHAYIEAGGATLDHYIEQSETYYIINGSAIMHIDQETFDIHAGSSFIVPPKSHQWIENRGDDKLEFLVIVDPPWQKEDEVVIT
ncbi:MAG: cupin domain-containing protein [Bacteroidetes bacterium]|nr:cupin domain-containing protein [Bacteroidota bacterium]